MSIVDNRYIDRDTIDHIAIHDVQSLKLTDSQTQLVTAALMQFAMDILNDDCILKEPTQVERFRKRYGELAFNLIFPKR